MSLPHERAPDAYLGRNEPPLVRVAMFDIRDVVAQPARPEGSSLLYQRRRNSKILRTNLVGFGLLVDFFCVWRLNGKHEVMEVDTLLEHMEDAERRCLVLTWVLDTLLKTIVEYRGTVPDGFTFRSVSRAHLYQPFVADDDREWFFGALDEMFAPAK